MLQFRVCLKQPLFLELILDNCFCILTKIKDESTWMNNTKTSLCGVCSPMLILLPSLILGCFSLNIHPSLTKNKDESIMDETPEQLYVHT